VEKNGKYDAGSTLLLSIKEMILDFDEVAVNLMVMLPFAILPKNIGLSFSKIKLKQQYIFFHNRVWYARVLSDYKNCNLSLIKHSERHMGILHILFGRNGKKRTFIKSSIEKLEDSVNEQFEESVNLGDDPKSAQQDIPNALQNIVKRLNNDSKDKVADVWKCLVCGFENISSITFCASCKNKAGKWKCPICGRIYRADIDLCACKFNWNTWTQCEKCNKWYNGQKFEACPNH
jgi:hypothetical protein